MSLEIIGLLDIPVNSNSGDSIWNIELGSGVFVNRPDLLVDIKLGSGVWIGSDAPIFISSDDGIEISNSIKICTDIYIGSGVYIGTSPLDSNGGVYIGTDVYIEHGFDSRGGLWTETADHSLESLSDNREIILGSHLSIGDNGTFISIGENGVDIERPKDDKLISIATNVKIGSNVEIGSGVYIEPGFDSRNISDNEGGAIEIVNDLTTGGADKALSAEMGKVLAKEATTEHKGLMSAEDKKLLSNIEEEIAEHSTVRFDRIEENEATINAGEIGSTPSAIVYYKPANKFVAADSAGNYWDTWDGMEAYMSGGKIREDKVYLCKSELYILSGSEFISLISTHDKLKINGVFSYLSNAPLNIVLSKFLKSIKINGISKDKELSFWDAKRNVDGIWSIRIVYKNSEYGNYAINYRSNTEESNIHIETSIYIGSRLNLLTADLCVDWEAIPEDGTLSVQSRTSNTIDTRNQIEINLLKSPYLDIDNVPETDIEAKRFVDFFKQIDIIGNYSGALSPYNITRNKNGRWAINFLDANTSTTEYALSINLMAEDEYICAKIDETSFMVLHVDWSVVDDSGTISQNLSRTQIKLSSNCYKRFSEFSNLSGKRILIFGDSITALKRANKNGTEKSYSDILEELAGCKIYNVAIGGTRLSRRTSLTTTPTNSTEAYAALDIVELVKAFHTGVYTYQDAANDWLLGNGQNGVTKQLDTLKSLSFNSIDYVFISAGTNDSQWVNIGGIDDEIETTLLGSINLICKYINSTSKKLFAFTPIVRYFISAENKASWGDRYIPTDGNYMTLSNVVDCIAKGWRRNHIPVADMYWSLGINENNFYHFFPSNDSTHPNYYGLERMAIAIKNFVNSYPHYGEFKTTEKENPVFDRLIPTNYRFNYIVSKFFKKVRIIGAPETLRIAIWDIHRGTQDGKWSIKMLEYDENPDASGGYICTISATEEMSLLKGNISGDRGTIEMCVDWEVFDDSTGIGANNHYTSRFALECYENY